MVVKLFKPRCNCRCLCDKLCNSILSLLSLSPSLLTLRTFYRNAIHLLVLSHFYPSLAPLTFLPPPIPSFLSLSCTDHLYADIFEFSIIILPDFTIYTRKALANAWFSIPIKARDEFCIQKWRDEFFILTTQHARYCVK